MNIGIFDTVVAPGIPSCRADRWADTLRKPFQWISQECIIFKNPLGSGAQPYTLTKSTLDQRTYEIKSTQKASLTMNLLGKAWRCIDNTSMSRGDKEECKDCSLFYVEYANLLLRCLAAIVSLPLVPFVAALTCIARLDKKTRAIRDAADLMIAFQQRENTMRKTNTSALHALA